MADFTPSTNLSGASAWEPTKKQLEMSTARNPLNFNQQNEMRKPAGETPPWQKSPEQQQALTQEAEKAKRNQQSTPMGSAAPSQAQTMAQQVGANLGSLGLLLQQRVNQFLSGGPKMFGLQETELDSTFDPTKGYAVSSKVSANLDPTIKQKLEEQQAIKQAAQPFLNERGEAKTFDQYIEGQFGKNANTDYMLGLLDQLHEYENMGAGDSAQARGIWDSLKSLDRDGMITSLYKAEKDYNRYFGLGDTEGVEKWSGTDPNEAKSLMDMLKLSQDEIRDEVENSILSASGLFSGNFESNIKDMLDKAATKVNESRALSARARNDFRSTLQKYLSSDTEGTGALAAEREKYKEAYDKLSDDVVSELSAADGGLAQAWVEAMGDKGLRETLVEALEDPNSGMSTAQRSQIQSLIGDMDSQGGGRGQLFQWLDDLQNNGYLVHEGKKIYPSNDKLMKISEAIRNPNLTPEQRDQAIKDEVGSIMLDEKHSIKNYLDDALKSVAMGENTETALLNLKDGMVKSLKDFYKTRTFDLIKKSLSEKKDLIGDVDNTISAATKPVFDQVMSDGNISADEWSKMTDAQRTEIAKEIIKHNPTVMREAAKELKAKADSEASTFEGAKKGIKDALDEKIGKIKSIVDVGVSPEGKLVLAGTGKAYDMLKTIEEKKAKVPKDLWTSFVRNVDFVPTQVDTYNKMLRSIPYVTQQMADKNPPDLATVEKMYDTLARANAYQTFFSQNSSGTNKPLVYGKGETIWSFDQAAEYMNIVNDALNQIKNANPDLPPGQQAGNYANAFMNGIVHDKSFLTDAKRKAIEMFYTNLDQSKLKVEEAIKNAQSELDQYVATKDALDKTGALSSQIFSPDNIFKEVLMPVAKQIESGGLTAVDLSRLPPELQPFVKKTEGNVAYLDMGEFGGIPSLTSLAEGAAVHDVPLPASPETMGMPSGWETTTATTRGKTPQPVIAPPPPIAPAPSETPAKSGGAFKAVGSANKGKADKEKATEIAKSKGAPINLPWIPHEGATSDGGNTVAAKQYLESLKNNRTHEEALSDAWMAYFHQADVEAKAAAEAKRIADEEARRQSIAAQQAAEEEAKKKAAQYYSGSEPDTDREYTREDSKKNQDTSKTKLEHEGKTDGPLRE